MGWTGTELLIRIAADFKKYRSDMREVGRETEAAMKQAERGTDGFTSSTQKLEQQSTRTAQQVARIGQAAADGNFARAGQEMAGMATGAEAAGVAVGGLGAILATATLALGAYLLISFKAAEEHERQANLMRLTGNAAGLLAGDINAMARSVAEASDSTVGDARSVTEALVATGKIGKPALQSVATAIELVSRASGESSERVTADFAKMADGVTKWAAEHNERYHFLNIDQYNYIKGLEDAGRQQEAMQATGEALQHHLQGMSVDVGFLQGAWRSLGQAASKAWDQVLNLGRGSTASSRLESVNSLIKEFGTAGGNPAVLAQLRERQALLQEDVRLEQRSAAAQYETAQATQRKIDAGQAWDKISERNQTGQQRLADALAEVRKQGEAAGKSEKEIIALQNQVTASMDRVTGASHLRTLAEQQLRKEERERLAAQKEMEQLLARVSRQSDAQSQTYVTSADAVMRGNEALRSEIELIGLDERSRRALQRVKEAEVLADKELLLIGLQNADADATTIANLEREIRLRRQRIDLLDKKGAYTEAFGAQTASDEAIKREKDDNERRSQALTDSISEGILGGIRNGTSMWQVFTRELEAQFSKIVLQPVIKPVAQGMSNVLNSLFSTAVNYFTGGAGGAGGSAPGSFDSNAWESFVPSAKGNIFSTAPALSSYRNTVVTEPTVFPFAQGGVGVMGEKAGSPGEAIMPLQRMSGGDLGVKVSGGGGAGALQVTVKLVNASGTPLQATSQKTTTGADGSMQIEVMVEAIASALGDQVANGSGPLTRGIESRFGLRAATA